MDMKIKHILTAFIIILASFVGGVAHTPSRGIDPEVLAKSVTIHRDSFGVPHIFSKTDAGVIFGLMYAQCEDNFWQLETDLIRAVGRAAELDGEKGISNDLEYRAFEMEQLSKDEYQKLPEKMRVLCDAAAAGINYYIAKNVNVRPRLIRNFEPWFFLASSRNGRVGSLTRAGIKPGEIRFGTPEPDGTATSDRNVPKIEDLQGRFEERVEDPAEGSNMWVINRSRSASGNAMLMINPHVGFFGGGQRYEAHLRSDEGINVYGFAILATPYIRTGFNENLGWSHTNNYADTADIYFETFDDPKNPLAYRYGNGYRQAVEWTDAIRIKTESGVEVRRYRFRKTHHGLVIGSRDGRQMAIRIARLLEGGEFEQRIAMNRARNFREFKAALSMVALTGSNTIYADRQGNIFYVHGNAIPRRATKFDWANPVDGANPETEWAEDPARRYHTLDELPHMLNPRSGYLQNCNSTPFLMTASGNLRKEDYPAYMAPEEDTPRAKSSRRILDGRKKFTFEDWTRAATDTTVNEATAGINLLTDQWELMKREDEARAEELKPAILELKAWDKVARTDSTATTLFLLWHERINNDKENYKYKELITLERVQDDLEKDFGNWKVAWGEINRLQRVHTSGEAPFSDAQPSYPVAGGPGPAGMIFTYGTRKSPGQKRRYGVSGNSFVAVVEFGKINNLRARSVLVFGQSADPNSKHHLDQAELYAGGQFKEVRFTLTQIKANLERTYQPGN